MTLYEYKYHTGTGMKKRKRAPRVSSGGLTLYERQLQALQQTHGIWKDDPHIAEAFKDLAKGWERWRAQLEGS